MNIAEKHVINKLAYSVWSHLSLR